MGSSVLPQPFVLAQPTQPLIQAIPGHTAGPPCYARPWSCVYSRVTGGPSGSSSLERYFTHSGQRALSLLWQREVKLSPAFALNSLQEVSSGISTLCHLLRKKAQAYGIFFFCASSLWNRTKLVSSWVLLHFMTLKMLTPHTCRKQVASYKGEWGTRLESFIWNCPAGRTAIFIAGLTMCAYWAHSMHLSHLILAAAGMKPTSSLGNCLCTSSWEVVMVGFKPR